MQSVSRSIEADPLEAWRVTKDDWARHKKYEEYLAATEEMLELTESEYAPWTIVGATSKSHTRKKVFETIIGALEKRLGSKAPPRVDIAAAASKDAELRAAMDSLERRQAVMLETVDLTRTLDRQAYVREVTRRQIQLRELGYQVYLQKRPVIIVFEGWDAAGKGGAIKRITEKLDPRGYVVYPISAPHGEDKTRHYLYRFWRRLPERGQIAIFDRSWYGRVLVERVEGFATRSGMETRLQGNQLLRAAAARLRRHSWPSSGFTSRARNNFAASKSAKPSATRRGSSPTKTGATARSGTLTKKPWKRCW